MSWLKRLGLAAFGILAIAFTAVLALLQKEKKERAEQELEDTEASQRVSRRATEAMIKGVANEGDKEDSPRKYKFGNHS